MTTRSRFRERARLAAVACLALGLAVGATGCAGIPTSGEVRDGAADVNEPGEIVYYAAGPAVDGEPQTIVEGFLRAAEAGPQSTVPFSVAQEFLTVDAWNGWERYARVLVLEGDPVLTVEESADSEEASRSVLVRATASVVASLDERGVYSEEPRPSPIEVTFALTRASNGQWRISQLEDGLLLSSAVFTTAFHRTTLHFPTPDLSWWVPDVRWFPRQTWRTHAVRELLSGPVPWLGDSVVSVFPEGTQLAIEAVTVDESGAVGVNLTAPISEASAEDRALIVAQLRATLVEGEGRTVELYDRTAPLRPAETAEPSMPVTRGDAVAYTEGVLKRVEGRSLVDLEIPVSMHGLEPTALALGPSDDPVVVRVGTSTLVRVTGPEAPVELMSGIDLAPPSVDRFGAVWSGEGSSILVALPSGRTEPVAADWLEGRTVESVRVSPEGARIAVVSGGSGGRQVHVAGIVRDAEQLPTGLSSPMRVGAPVDGATQVVWQEDTVLGLVGRDENGARTVFLSGVGGIGGQGGGVTRQLTGVVDPAWITAAVGRTEILALDDDGTLFSRQSSALWPIVSEGVELVAYPG
jgi:hypothetical protein